MPHDFPNGFFIPRFISLSQQSGNLKLYNIYLCSTALVFRVYYLPPKQKVFRVYYLLHKSISFSLLLYLVYNNVSFLFKKWPLIYASFKNSIVYVGRKTDQCSTKIGHFGRIHYQSGNKRKAVHSHQSVTLNTKAFLTSQPPKQGKLSFVFQFLILRSTMTAACNKCYISFLHILTTSATTHTTLRGIRPEPNPNTTKRLKQIQQIFIILCTDSSFCR